MKEKITSFIICSLFFSVSSHAQEVSVFTDIKDGVISHTGNKEKLDKSEEFLVQSSESVVDSAIRVSPANELTEGSMKNHKVGGNVNVPERGSERVRSFYTGDSHELNIPNLMRMIEEVGLSNQLFVLAQAVLETGHFRSRVCKEDHNLFGLRNPRTHRYYRFARWEDSVIGYQKYVQYKYKGGNYLTFLKRLGYAESPTYTQKVAKIARQLYKQLCDEGGM